MGIKTIQGFLLLVLLCQRVRCVRVSPKLDFGNDNAPDGAKFRPTLQSKSFNYGDSEHKLQGVDVTCTSGNCNVPDKQHGIATDVVVHIKTNVDADEKSNSTEAVPDIPIIVGTKTNEFPLYNAPNPFNNDLQPPFPISNLIRNGMQQPELRINGGSDYNNYALGLQGSSNGGDLYPVYNEQNPRDANLPLPQFTWNSPKRVSGGSNYNPLEFRKVYHNSWSDFPLRRMTNEFSDTGNNPSNWGPCLCPNPQEQYYPSRNPRY